MEQISSKKTKNIITIAFFLLGLLIAIFSVIFFNSDILTAVVFASTLTACVLNMNKKSLAFVFYTIQVLVYGIVSYYNSMYGEAIINLLYLLPLYFITMITKVFNKNRKVTVLEPIDAPLKLMVICVVSVIVITVGYGFILRHFASSQPFLNALTTALVIFASFMTAKQYKQQWIVWIVLDIVWIIMWSITLTNGLDNLPLVIQNVWMLPINIVGLISWTKKTKEEPGGLKENEL